MDEENLELFQFLLWLCAIKCGNTNVISISKNLIQCSKTNPIEIRYYFLRDHAQKDNITLEFANTSDQLVDIFTKPLNEDRFVKIEKESQLIQI